MCYHLRLITRSVKCIVTMWWVMAWLGNGFGCSMKDERTCTMRREVGVHIWWMMTCCVRLTKECVTTDVSQFLICPCTFLRFQGLYSMTLSVMANIAGSRILWGGYTKTCASIMAANMWENCLKNVESDNNNILCEPLLDFLLPRNGTYFLNKPVFPNLYTVNTFIGAWEFVVQVQNTGCYCSNSRTSITIFLLCFEIVLAPSTNARVAMGIQLCWFLTRVIDKCEM